VTSQKNQNIQTKEEKMKKRKHLAVLFVMLFAGLLVLGVPMQSVLAAERVVEFSIPACE
jgi:hypothetical protein